MRINYLSKQDIKIILHYLGYLIGGIGFVLLFPIFVDLIFGEFVYPIGLIPPIFSIILGALLVLKFREYDKLKFKHGMFISAIAWLWAGFIAALIMMLILDISFLDAFFENISAWTGSGLTLFNDVESLPRSILFLRSLEQWIGGLGVVVIFLTILIKPGSSAYRLYRSEAREEKLKPNIRNTLIKTIEIYSLYTALGIALYVLAGMPLFDSINLTFTTISTGGMSIKNANVGFYNNNVIYLITMFLMLLGATSFTVHYEMAKTKKISIFKDMQVQFMILAIAISGIIIALITNIAPMEVIFHIVSAITTTGANIATPSELASWVPASLILIMCLMVMGGSSGSTVGAVKLIRVLTFLKSVDIGVTNAITPKRVVTKRIAKKSFSEREMMEASSYIIIYLMILLISWVIMMFFTHDPINTLFDVTSTIGNVGLSTGIINGDLDTIPKILLIFLMWIGRLEILPVLITFRLGIDTFAQSLKIIKRSLKRKIQSI